jgi:LAO/AO transport system ATPase
MAKAGTRKPRRDWKRKLLSGDRAALSRAITAVENDTADARAVLAAVYGRIGKARVVGFTGAPGVGKSTLLSAYVRELRGRGKTIGVVAVDPSSPLTGGAILGDRVRMAEHGNDAEVFVRSLASRGQLGGLSRAAGRVVDVMDAAGREVVIVETVGTGQSEVEVADLVQTNVVVCAPGLGDQIQALKAGVVETAHVLVVNKADMAQARTAERQLKEAVALAPHQGGKVPVLLTVATTGEGVAELADAIEAHGKQRDPEESGRVARKRMRRLIAAAAARQVGDAIEASSDARLEALCEAVLKGEMDLAAAAAQALNVESMPDI